MSLGRKICIVPYGTKTTKAVVEGFKSTSLKTVHTTLKMFYKVQSLSPALHMPCYMFDKR